MMAFLIAKQTSRNNVAFVVFPSVTLRDKMFGSTLEFYGFFSCEFMVFCKVVFVFEPH